MVRGTNSGDGMRPSVYYLASPELASPELASPELASPELASPELASPDRSWARPRVRALDGADPLGDEYLSSGGGSGSGWSGAGGRWLLWPLRAVLWAALLVVAFRGVTAIIFNQQATSPGASAGPAAAAGQFPVTLAEAYAAEFGRVYLNFNPQAQAQREQQLAEFVPARVATADPDLGWSGTGQESLQSEQVAGIAVQDSQHAVVTLLALVNGQLMELGVPIAASGGAVPIAASGGAVVVAGEPAWLPAPAQVSLPPAAAQGSDPVAQSQLNNELPAFFQAYANGDSGALNRFLAPGVSLTGLGGTVSFDSIAALHVPSGGTSREITVSVIWQLLTQGAATGAKLQVTYGMLVVQQSGVKWYVKTISASIEAVGAQ